jgi:glutamate formiminotransferase/formiminotetrahydrofolate cyclodeaminase
LKARRLHELVDELSTDSPAPGGGSAAALCGALAAALSSMVAALTWSKKGAEGARAGMKSLGERAQASKDWFLDAVDRDAEAFRAVLEARRLPRGTAEEQAARAEAMERANETAARVPLEVLGRSIEALELALAAAREGNPASVSDAGVAGACARAAAEGAAMNVRVNLPSVGARELATSLAAETDSQLRRALELADLVRRAVDEVLARPG